MPIHHLLHLLSFFLPTYLTYYTLTHTDTKKNMDTDIRVRLRFITHDASIRVTEAPLAVPVQLNRKGLSEVINHLRTATSGASKGNNEEEEEATDTHTHTQTQLYDFVIENQLLRCSLEKFLRATGLSTETTVSL